MRSIPLFHEPLLIIKKVFLSRYLRAALLISRPPALTHAINLFSWITFWLFFFLFCFCFIFSCFTFHCIKCQNSPNLPRVEILWKRAVSVEFRAIRLKVCGSCEFPQNFHTIILSCAI